MTTETFKIDFPDLETQNHIISNILSHIDFPDLTIDEIETTDPDYPTIGFFFSEKSTVSDILVSYLLLPLKSITFETTPDLNLKILQI